MKRRSLITLALILISLSFCSGNRQDSVDYKKSISAKNITEIEKSLRKSDSPYLIFNFKKKEIQIRLLGYELVDIDFSIESDSTESTNFLKTVTECDSPIFKINRINMFEGDEKIDEIKIDAVRKALNADPEEIQRYYPSRMNITLTDGLILKVFSSAPGHPISLITNTIEYIRYYFSRTFGAKIIKLTMTPDDAMALYSIASNKNTNIIIIQ